MKRKWPSPESSVVKVNPGFEVTLTAGSIAASTVVPSRRTTRRAASVVAAGTFSVEPRSVVPPGVTANTRSTFALNSWAGSVVQRLLSEWRQ